MSDKKISLPLREGDGAWYEAGLRFKCTQCGNCCSGGPGYVWLTVEDMERIAGFLGMAFNDFTGKYVRRISGRYSLVEKADYDCVFLKREGGKAMCGIYPVRPMQCRTWPFWDQNLRSPRAWTEAAGRCPGMADADAPLYQLDHIEKNRVHPENP